MIANNSTKYESFWLNNVRGVSFTRYNCHGTGAPKIIHSSTTPFKHSQIYLLCNMVTKT